MYKNHIYKLNMYLYTYIYTVKHMINNSLCVQTLNISIVQVIKLINFKVNGTNIFFWF